MTLDVAFARLSKLEGSPGAAHQAFMSAIMGGRVRCKAARKLAEHWGMDEDRYNEMEAGEDFWNNVYLKYCDGLVVPFQNERFGGDEEYILPDGNVMNIEEWEVFVETDSFEKLFLGRVAPAVPTKKLGGRPPKHDWARAAAVVAAYVAENDYPAHRSTLVEAMRACFADAGSCPDHRDIERFVAEVYKEKERLETQRSGQTRFPRVSP